MSTLVSIAGIPISPKSGLQWAMTFGVEPFQQVINVERKRGLAIFEEAGGQPTTVQIGEEIINGVYVTSTTAGSDRHHIGLVIQDVRWLWPGIVIHRGYNIRQRTGEVLKKPSGDGKDLIENVRLVNDAKYFEWSLDGETPWILEDAFIDTFNEMGFDGFTVPIFERTLPLEDFEENETADKFLSLLLQRAPGYNVFIDRDGNPVVFDQTDNSEADVIEGDLPPPIEGTGWVEMADRRYERPELIEVLFTIEQELKFTYDEESALGETLIQEERGREALTLENVLPIPTKFLEINGRDLFEGSWITFQQLFDSPTLDDETTAIQTFLSGLHYIDKFNNKALRQGYLTDYELQNRFVVDYDAGGQPNKFWSDIVNGSLEHWRRMFRIIKPWRDRIRSYRANRVGIVDFENRSRAPARAYMNYTVQPTERMYLASSVGDRYEHGWFFDGYRDDLSDPEAIPAPSIIRVRDQENGIVQVLLKKGPYGEESRLIPGTPDALPVNISAGATEAVLIDDQVDLSPDFRLALVLTCLKAAPNNNGVFHSVYVRPDRAQKVLNREIGACEGPIMQVRIAVSPTTTARFHWDDSKASEIKESFFTGAALPESLLSNKEHVEHIAEAAAASVYSALLDRYEGGYSFTQTQGGRGLEPTGAIGAVAHQHLGNSTVRSRVELPRIVQPVDLASLLPSSTKRAVLGVVQP